MEKFLLYCRKKANCYSKNPADEKLSLFPVMRILMPSLDKERGSYNMKESVIADLYIEFLQLGKTSADAVKLKNYKAPKVVQDDAGDFASVVYTVMLDRSYPGNKLSLFQVNQKLDEIVRATQTEGRRKVAEVLKYLFLNQSPQEQKWLLRIILKEMGMGIGTNSMFAAFHRDAKDLYEVNSNLRKVCEDLHDPSIRLNQIGIQIFDAFKPQLADRIQLANLETIMKDKSWYIETKYDGERMQAHYKDNKFKFFSRNGNDFTVEFGASGQEINKFSKFLASSLELSKVKSIILDGEICAWHKDENRIVQKADKYDIRNIKADNQKYQQCLIIYDICYLNGKVLTALPLKERIDIYKGLINPQPGRIQFSERKIVTSAEEVVEALHKAIDDREEGLVLKDQSSVYKPGARANSGWIKLKPDYENGLMDTVDLVVLGGYYGSGRHSGNVAQFLLGLQDTSTNPARFKSFCRVANGFNDEERVDLVKKCGPGLRTGQPADVDVTKEKPDVWYNPVTAPVLQVNAAEMIYSSSYAVGSTLRFPRVEQIRTDKDSSSCTTLEEIQTIKLKGGGKLFGNKRIGDLQTLSQPKRARIADDNSSSRKAGGGSSKRIPVFVNQQPLLDLSQEKKNKT